MRAKKAALTRRRRLGECFKALAPWLLIATAVLSTNSLLDRYITDTRLRPRYERPELPLRDRTRAQNFYYLFDILDRIHDPELSYVFLLGDSTVQDVAAALQRSLPLVDVRVVDLGLAGLMAEEALLLAAEAESFSPALLLYGINPRALADPSADGEVFMRLRGHVSVLAGARAGSLELPLPYLLSHYGSDKLARNFVHGNVSAVRFSSLLADEQGRACLDADPPPWLAYFCRSLLTKEPVYDIRHEGHGWRRHLYMKSAFDFDNDNTEAFRLLVELCERKGNCLFYDGPRDSSCDYTFEDGIIDGYEDYLDSLPALQEFRIDLSGILSREHFPERQALPCDGLHPNAEGKALLGRRLANEVVKRLKSGH